jgi:hypothetical protein
MTCRIAWVCLAGLWITGSLRAQVPQVAVTDDLAFAAASLERGEDAAAIAHLRRYVTARPDSPLVRFTLADLLWKRDRVSEAGVEYERFIHDTPASTVDLGRLIHAHVRLVTVAGQRNDSFGEHLHRGIGLYLLAGQSIETASTPEELLFKAAGELTLATHDRPAEARPHLYLHLVWARLAQSQPAERHLRQAIALAVHSDLGPAERRDLAVAGDVDRAR